MRTLSSWTTLVAVVVCLSALLWCAPERASAEVTLGPHFGLNFDWDEVFIGGELRADIAQLSSSVLLQLDPSLSLAFFGGGGVAMDFSFNVPFLFMIHDSVLRPFAAPGLALVHYTGGGGYTDLYLNLIGGLLFDLGSVDPFVQLKVMIPHGSMAELMGGVLFKID